jgi:hypothetical protein
MRGSLRDNEAAYDKFKIRQRVLVDVAEVDTSITIFGEKVSLPFAFAPSAMQGLAHSDAEKGTARAAAAFNIPMGLSTYSTTSLEDVIAERGASTNPYVFQLSIPKDRSVPLGLIQRAAGEFRTRPQSLEERSRGGERGRLESLADDALSRCWVQGAGSDGRRAGARPSFERDEEQSDAS